MEENRDNDCKLCETLSNLKIWLLNIFSRNRDFSRIHWRGENRVCLTPDIPLGSAVHLTKGALHAFIMDLPGETGSSLHSCQNCSFCQNCICLQEDRVLPPIMLCKLLLSKINYIPLWDQSWRRNSELYLGWCLLDFNDGHFFITMGW